MILKPENVIVTSKGVAKLTDFGLSRSVTARISQEGAIVGTVYYLAPEQALRQDIDHRADLYALGVMMYELTAGRLPFTADDPLGVISQHLNAPVVPPSTYNPNIPPVAGRTDRAPDEQASRRSSGFSRGSPSRARPPVRHLTGTRSRPSPSFPH